MMPLIVTDDTAARFRRIADCGNLSDDTLVSLALDALEVADSLSTHARELADFRRVYRECRNGSHYVEAVA